MSIHNAGIGYIVDGLCECQSKSDVDSFLRQTMLACPYLEAFQQYTQRAGIILRQKERIDIAVYAYRFLLQTDLTPATEMVIRQCIGTAFEMGGLYDKLILEVNAALTRLEVLPKWPAAENYPSWDGMKARLTSMKATYYWKVNQVQEMCDAHMDALSILDQIDYESVHFEVYRGFATILSELGMPKEAKKFLLGLEKKMNSITYVNAFTEQEDRLWLVHYLGKVYVDMLDWDNAKIYYLKAEQLMKKMDMKHYDVSMSTYQTLALIYSMEKNIKKCKKYAKKATEISKEDSFKHYVSDCKVKGRSPYCDLIITMKEARLRWKQKEAKKLGIDPREIARNVRKSMKNETCCDRCGAKHVELKKCGGCGDVFYCSRECQKLQWKAHKPFCKR